jgi:hypothetical protein
MPGGEKQVKPGLWRTSREGHVTSPRRGPSRSRTREAQNRHIPDIQAVPAIIADSYPPDPGG